MRGYPDTMIYSEVPSQYPEHAKMERVMDKSQTIGEFLEWLSGKKRIVLAHYGVDKFDDYLYPLSYDTEELLAQYFGINLNKVEQEKRQMLEEIRSK